MQIKIEKVVSEPIEVEYGDKKFVVYKPKAGFLRGLEAKAKVDPMGMMFEFCEAMGVPEDILKNFELEELKQFFQLMQGMLEKKTPAKPTS